MTLFRKNVEGNIDLPDGFIQDDRIVRRKFFKIIIKEVDEVSKPETELILLHKETGKKIDSYDYNYKMKEEEKKNYVKVKKETGRLDVNTTEREVLNQTKENLDVSDLALYINRGRD